MHTYLQSCKIKRPRKAWISAEEGASNFSVKWCCCMKKFSFGLKKPKTQKENQYAF